MISTSDICVFFGRLQCTYNSSTHYKYAGDDDDDDENDDFNRGVLLLMLLFCYVKVILDLVG